ncbi:MAG: nucleotide exchange factor GrpE [Bradyrhizobiaceae bacterium]|nr:nucleotide exchange factor GrpE [Bradyrhizobiaceae bacterium]
MNHYTEDAENTNLPFDEVEPTGSSETEHGTTDAESTLEQELEEWKDLALRRAADIENIRRRHNAEREQMARFASESLLTKLLPIFDDLHHAVEAARKTEDAAALKEGLELIYAKTVKILAEVGVTAIDGESGEPFHVDLHEALMHTPSDVPEGHLVQTIQRGYMLHDRVLRHAKVVTSAGPLSPTDSKE